MKICHFSSSHPARDIRIFLKECKSLADAGHEVTLVVPNAEDFTENGVDVKAVNLHIKNRFSRLIKGAIKTYNEAVKVNADIYHFHDSELIFFGLLLKLRGKKVVYDVHEDVPRQILSKSWIKKPIREIVSKVFEIFENFAAKRFNAIVGATPYITERFAKIGCKNPTNINNYPMLQELFVDGESYKVKENSVCFIGGINQIRGIKEMVEAIDKTELKLLLGGKFSRESLKEQIKTLPGWDNVDDLGFVDRKKVADIMSKSLAGLVLYHPVPNHINAQPNKMFEYMSAGIPVLASNFDLWREIIEGNNCGLCVNPLDVDQIAEALNWIAENQDEVKQMGINGRMAIENKYNWEKESEKLIELYSQLA